MELKIDQVLNAKISSGASARAKESVLAAMERVNFRDPVSGHYPESGPFEEAVSGLVALYHNIGRIAWSRVPLRSLCGEATGVRADTIISSPGILVPEFPLLHSTQDEESTWGWMRIDLLYFDGASKTVGFFDSKLGSPFHYDPTPKEIQPARYLERIVRLASPKSFFIFATSCTLFGEPGYLPILRAAREFSEQRRAFAALHVIAWEDVVGALAA